ncbi:MAG TPA: hypothetical protein VGU69_10570 [Rhizomicrobium sp.]|nr:hypothetical protein [Rhizomicrobium sp.]
MSVLDDINDEEPLYCLAKVVAQDGLTGRFEICTGNDGKIYAYGAYDGVLEDIGSSVSRHIEDLELGLTKEPVPQYIAVLVPSNAVLASRPGRKSD